MIIENSKFIIGTDRRADRATAYFRVVVKACSTERPFAHAEFTNVPTVKFLMDAFDEIGRRRFAAGGDFPQRMQIVIIDSIEL